jgi:putative inorganic carbon (hco3(-)) transporter
MDVTPLRLSLLLGLLFVVPSLLSGKWPVLTHPLGWGAALFLLCGLGAQMNAPAPEIGWNWLDYLFRLLLIALIGARLIDTRERYLGALAVVAISFGFHPARAGWAALIDGGGQVLVEGLGGAFGDNNGYATGIAMIIPLLIGAAQNLKSQWLRWLFWAAAMFCTLGVIATYSRGGLLALGAGIAMLAGLQKRKLIGVLALTALVSGLGLWMSSQAGYLDRMNTIRTYQEVDDQSALGRLHFWRVAIDMVRDHPLGIGFFNYEAAYDRYDFLNGSFGTRRSVHNSHLQALAETGYLGALIWATLFAYAFIRLFRIRTLARSGTCGSEESHFLITVTAAMLASMTAFLVGGTFVAMALNDLTWLTFALVIALDRLVVQIAARTQPAAHIALLPRVSFARTAPSI